MGGVSAISGMVGASSKASAQRKQIDEQVRVVETQRMLNRLEASSQRQTIELNDQRQRQLLGQQQAIALANNDLQTQQAQLQQTQAQIEQDRANVLNQQRVFQRKAAANQQAAQVFTQLNQESKKQEQQYTQGQDQQAQKENALAGSKTTGQSMSSEAAADRLLLAVQNGQIDARALFDGNIQRELAQLGYEYNVADIEQRLGQAGLDYQQRDLGRVGELTGIQSDANRNDIGTQSDRNRSAMAYELATQKSALSQAEASSEVNTNSQVQGLQYQRKMSAGPSVFDWATTLGGIGLNVYAASKDKQPQQNNQFITSDTQRANVGPGAPSYLPTDGAPSFVPNSSDFTPRALDASGALSYVPTQGAPSYMPGALGSVMSGARIGSTPMPTYNAPFIPTERVFTRDRTSYDTGKKLTTGIFRRS